ERTPWGRRIRLVARAEHTPLIETEILLPDGVKRIELRNTIQVDLLYAKQASYFAFPWAMSKPQFRYDIANGFVDPAKNLLEGACSEWFSLQQTVNVEDGQASVDLGVVDAPLLSLGDIYRGRWPCYFTNASPTVFSYLLNNYWSAKWAGQKSWELASRYAITSGPHFAPAETARFGRETRTPFEISELKASDKPPGRAGRLPPAEAGFVLVEPQNIIVSAFKAAEDGRGLVLRVLETGGRECDGAVRLPLFRVSSATEATAVETPGKALKCDSDSVRFHIKPNQILTIRLQTR
ncbi:MAG TPA: glycosyl hydrolase-related protein, partial [Verrucomicrobiae bacterium]